MKEVFGATEQLVVPRSEGLVMHGELRVGDSVLCLQMLRRNSVHALAGIYIYVEHLDEVYNKALADGAVSTIEPTHQSYGYTCGIKDPFGNDWWLVEIPAGE